MNIVAASCDGHVTNLYKPVNFERLNQSISWTDRMINEKVIGVLTVKEERNILHKIKRRDDNWIGHIYRRNCLLKRIIEGKIGGIMWLEDKEEDVSSYWMTLRKREDTVN